MMGFIREASPSLTWGVLKRKKSNVFWKRCLTWGLWRSYGNKIPCQKDHDGRLFLAFNGTRRSRFHQKMWQLPKVWKRPISPKRENDDHFLTLAIRTMGDRHYGPSTLGKEGSEILSHRNRLLHEMDRSRSSGNNHRSKVTKFCMEKYCVQVRDPKDDHLK